MSNLEKTPELNLKNVKFSHGVMNGSVFFTPYKLSLLSGKNGAGKSSLVQYIKHHQKDIFDSDVFIIDQGEFNPLKNLRGEDLLETLSQSVKKRVQKKTAMELVQHLNLSENFLTRAVKELSGGELQILKIILGLSIKAQYYILDEPFNNIDKGKRKKIREYFIDKSLGALIIDHFSDEWAEAFSYQFLVYNNQGHLSLNRIDDV